MTTRDKLRTLSQYSVSGVYSDGTPLVSRPYVWWNEALHGLEPHHEQNGPCAGDGKPCPTQFAEANALSCSWNASLWYETAEAIGTETRAYFQEGANGGLTVYGPQINLASNPLWGRVMECPGEDPYLTSVYAVAYIRGLQDTNKSNNNKNDRNSSHYWKVAATPKHLVGHFFEGDRSDPWSNGTVYQRYANDTRFTVQDLQQYYLPPFRAALVSAKAASVMCAYLSVNGVPMCANGFLLDRVVRKWWGWKGMVVSDCDAIANMMANETEDYNVHDYSLSSPMAVSDAIRAGCDQNCGNTFQQYGLQAIRKKLFPRKVLDRSVRRALLLLFRLGLFDPPDRTPFAQLGWGDVATPSHRKLALEGARQSVVLLQNGPTTTTTTTAKAKPVLPFAKNKRILVAGPLYNATDVMLGNYHGAACHDGTGSCLVSTHQWIERLATVQGGTVLSSKGVPPGCLVDTSGIPTTVDTARRVDQIVLVLGGRCLESEGQDRDDMLLPGSQTDLFEALAALHIPLVVVLINGGPYAIDAIVKRKDQGVAVLQTGFAGQEGAQAIAEVVFGDVNPSGKLTATVYPGSYTQGKPMKGTPWTTSTVRPVEGVSEGKSHLFYTGKALFPFGFGLSYTTFSLTLLHDDSQTETTDTIRLRLSNTGDITGREVVQAYWSPPVDVDKDLRRVLFDFSAHTLAPGKSTILQYSVATLRTRVSIVSESGTIGVPGGTYRFTFSRGHSHRYRRKQADGALSFSVDQRTTSDGRCVCGGRHRYCASR